MKLHKKKDHTKQELYALSLCKICNSNDRFEIEGMITAGVTFRNICLKFPEMNPMNVHRHKAHMVGDAPEKLQELINKGLHNNLDVNNISDLVRLLDHQKRYEETHYGDCSTCKYKQDKASNALLKFISEDADDDILEDATVMGADGEQHEIEKSETMSEEAYEKYKKDRGIKISGVT